MTIVWKLVAMCITDHYLLLLWSRHVILSTQFTLYKGSFAVDLLRVLHDHIHYCMSTASPVVIVVDDIHHAYGSVVHKSLEDILTAAGFASPMAFLLVTTAVTTYIRMAGSEGVAEAVARLVAGPAHGSPASAISFCVVNEIRAAVALANFSQPKSPGGGLAASGKWMTLLGVWGLWMTSLFSYTICSELVRCPTFSPLVPTSPGSSQHAPSMMCSWSNMSP